MQYAASTGPSATAYLGLLVVALLFAAIGYRSATRFRSRHGTTQWGVHPGLWALLCGFSVIVGAVLMSVAGRSTLRTISRAEIARSEALWPGGPGPGTAPGLVPAPAPAPGGPGPGTAPGLVPAPAPAPAAAAVPGRRGRTAAAVALFVIGPAAVVGGVVGSVAAVDTNLSGLAVATPGTGMVATAIGAGGVEPTQVLAGANRGPGVTASGVVPTTPTLFLQPVSTTNYGVKTGNEPAYWKVWWDGVTQQKDVVSLQQHLDDTSAGHAVATLDARNSNPSAFDSGGVTFTSVTSFSVPGIPGSDGKVWKGTVNGRAVLQFRFVVFSRGSVVALVSTTSYGGSADVPTFQDFAKAEYAAMYTTADPSSARAGFGVLTGVGLALILAAVITLIGSRFRPSLWPSAPGAVPGYGYSAGAPGAGPRTWPAAPAPPPPPPPGPGPWPGGAAWPGPPPGSGLGFPAPPTRSSAGLSSPPPVPVPSAGLPIAGWYPDPAGTEAKRYWDGERWTEATSGG